MTSTVSRLKSVLFFHVSKIVGREETEQELFMDSVDKQLDVFDFLEIERDDTSVSSSSSTFDDNDDLSFSSSKSSSSLYFDALHELYVDQEFFEEDIWIDENGVNHEDNTEQQVIDLHHEPLDSLQWQEERIDEQQEEEGNPIVHAMNFAHNIWEGSKHTPVGLVVNMTECVVGGVVGHLIRIIDNDKGKKHKGEDSERSPFSVEQKVEPTWREFASSEGVATDRALCTQTDLLADELKRRMNISMELEPRILCHPASGILQSGSSGASTDDDWLPLG